MGIRVRLLQANHGDSVLVAHESSQGTFNILIDGGNSATFRFGPQGKLKGPLCLLLDELKAKNQHIDLAILTHIDDDHIGGMLSAFKAPGYLKEMVKSIWFNSSRMITKHFNESAIFENEIYLSTGSPATSIEQAITFEALLNEIGCEQSPIIYAGQVLKKGPFTFTILSPDESKLRRLLCVWPDEKNSPDTSGIATDYAYRFDDLLSSDKFTTDASITNGSSIAFILDADDKSMLFLGDAHSETVVESLQLLGYKSDNKLNVDLIKISHHGSKNNTSPDFLKMVDSSRYLISTNGLKSGLPNKVTIARILASSEGKIFFNYEKIISRILLADDIETYAKRLKTLNKDIEL